MREEDDTDPVQDSDDSDIDSDEDYFVCNSSGLICASITMNIKSTTGFPTSHRWSAYVTPKSRKGGSKSDFFLFVLSKSRSSQALST